MDYLYKVVAGTGDYSHTMFITSDVAKAETFVEDYNKQFSCSYGDVYGMYAARVETCYDYVPELDHSVADCTSHVYVLTADKDFNIKRDNDRFFIFGYPLCEFVDPDGCGVDMLCPSGTECFEENLQSLLDNRHFVQYDDNMYDGSGGYRVMILMVDKENDYLQTVYTSGLYNNCDPNDKSVIDQSFADWLADEASKLLIKLRY